MLLNQFSTLPLPPFLFTQQLFSVTRTHTLKHAHILINSLTYSGTHTHTLRHTRTHPHTVTHSLTPFPSYLSHLACHVVPSGLFPGLTAAKTLYNASATVAITVTGAWQKNWGKWDREGEKSKLTTNLSKERRRALYLLQFLLLCVRSWERGYFLGANSKQQLELWTIELGEMEPAETLGKKGGEKERERGRGR